MAEGLNMKRTGPTNIHLRLLITKLRKKARENNARIWYHVAELLAKPRRQRIAVNLSKINKYTGNGEIVIVPGKVLGAGTLDHEVIVAAWQFSQKAYEKISKKGKCITIEELLEKFPRGSNVKIIT